MHLGVRHDEERGPTRTVVWAGGAESDLSAIAVAAAMSVVLVAATVAAFRFDGAARVAAIVIAVLAGLWLVAVTVPLLVIFGGVLLVKGLAAAEPSAAQRLSWILAPLLFGAVIGSDAYGIGVPGLLTGPALFAAVLLVVRAGPSLSRRARRRAVGLSAVVAASALAVGLTIFV